MTDWTGPDPGLGPAIPAARSWKRLLLLPTAIRLGSRAPRDHEVGWETYWRGVGDTGDAGDVLWDTDDPQEMDEYRRMLPAAVDTALPIVDAGCGNGRQTRSLIEHFPRVLGIDLSAAAIERAKAESGDIPGVQFRAVDITAPGAGRLVRDLVGEANVFVRGVFHVLSDRERQRATANFRTIVGRHGKVFVAETNFPGDALSYLRYLGARPGRIPRQLAKAIEEIPKPRHFGEPELRASFPESDWVITTFGETPISVVPMGTGDVPSRIPGFYGIAEPR